jgi:hypothetical protein
MEPSLPDAHRAVVTSAAPSGAGPGPKTRVVI